VGAALGSDTGAVGAALGGFVAGAVGAVGVGATGGAVGANIQGDGARGGAAGAWGACRDSAISPV
jgi:hypothetical protein